jgi:hypothetical protein
MESEARQDATAVPPPDAATDETVQRLREAAERRDRQLAELKARLDRASSTDPLAAANYEIDRRRIEEEYEQALRSGVPATYPWASAVPGMRTGGWEDPANAMRRGLVDPDPTSAMKTLTEQFSRLDSLLRRLIEAPRLAVAGPARCTPEGTDVVRPIR